jgi:hypothetical protein
LLRPLDGWTFQNHVTVSGYADIAFRHLASGASTPFDPRINWKELQVSATDERRNRTLSEEGDGHFTAPDKEYFESHGVRLQTIRLV